MIDDLRKKYPWPDKKPDLPFDNHGWFGWCHKALLDVVLPQDGQVIIEMGSWLGLSTRFLLSQVPLATILAIDHWKGDDSILQEADEGTKQKLPILHETFLSNCWDYRDRLVPMRTTTVEGLREIHELGIRPDFIYLDASHQYDDAAADLREIWSLYPDVRLAGDDYGGKWEGVKRAVDEHAERAGRVPCTAEHAWTIATLEEKKAIEKRIVRAMRFRLEERDRAEEAKRADVMASAEDEEKKS